MTGKDVIGLVLTVLVIMAIVGFIGAKAYFLGQPHPDVRRMRQEAAELGFGGYDPQTGEWRWNKGDAK